MACGMGGTKAETDWADGPRSTAKLEYKGHGKGTKAQVGQHHGVVSGTGGHARLSGTVRKLKGQVDKNGWGWVRSGQVQTRVGARTEGCWWWQGGCLDRQGMLGVHVACRFRTRGL